MKDRFSQLFRGRQGMDELSKMLFWSGLLSVILSIVAGSFLAGIPGTILRFLGLICIVSSFVRAFSRRIEMRETENSMYLAAIDREKHQWQAAKERRRQSGEYRFFKCPGCSKWLRVPRGQGKIHIKCKCGYTLYRKT